MAKGEVICVRIGAFLVSTVFPHRDAVVAEHVTSSVAVPSVAVLVRGDLTAGRHEVVWDASGLATGVYLYRLQIGTQAVVKSMLLMK